jgi:hypothetical protein
MGSRICELRETGAGKSLSRELLRILSCARGQFACSLVEPRKLVPFVTRRSINHQPSTINHQPLTINYQPPGCLKKPLARLP